MSAPNVDDPLAAEIAKHWKQDPNAAIAKAKQWTQQYAK